MKKYEELQLTDQKQEALTILMEECAEVIQECSKILRFDCDTESLTKEISDMMVMIEILERKNLLKSSQIEEFMENKRKKLKKYSLLDEFL